MPAILTARTLLQLGLLAVAILATAQAGEPTASENAGRRGTYQVELPDRPGYGYWVSP